MTAASNVAIDAWEPVIGLEVHVQLLTEAKLFSTESAAFGAPPNSQVSEVCAGLPGALPVVNRRAVELALIAGFALDCELQPRSRFVRKHYFYPDLPKGYQISQYEEPLFLGGRVEFPVATAWKSCRLRRIHIEEDAGKLVHGPYHSSVDLNRAGVPLIEVVTEPDLRAPEEAVALLRGLWLLLRYLRISDCSMEEGSMRCDANVSVRRLEELNLAVRTEIKNLNSFRFLEKALHFEIDRQIGIYKEGGEVIQETRFFDEAQGTTAPMRGKEEAEDYRYFPDPDLPPLVVDIEWVERIRSALPETPTRKLRRYNEELGLPLDIAVQLVSSSETARYFESALRSGAEAKAVAVLITQYLLPILGGSGGRTLVESGVEPDDLAYLLGRLQGGHATTSMVRRALERAITSHLSVRELMAEVEANSKTLATEIRSSVTAVLQQHPDQVEEYRAGKSKVLGYLMGQTLRSLGPQADPIVVRRLLEEVLSGGQE